MPKSVFLSHIASGLPSEIPNLARIFDVSLVAATRRLAWLKGWIAFESRNGKLIWSQPPSVILDVAQLPRSVEPTTFDGTIDGVFSTWRAEPTVANTRSTIGVVFRAI